jgi:glutamate formiminotransferase
VKIFECVPNVSEGRDAQTIEACRHAILDAGVCLAHATSDPDHHRSVFTFFGSAERVLEAAVALAAVAVARIDLRAHRGAHPRIGALDVLPVVPFGSATIEDAGSLARACATRIWNVLGVPSFLYGAAAPGLRRSLPEVRAGEFEGLAARSGAFDAGDRPHPSAGAIAVGARTPLVAFNIELATHDLALGNAIARCLRERGGGLIGLRVIALVRGTGCVQISCNLTDAAATPLHRVTALVRGMATQAGTSVTRTELIGLVPRAAVSSVVAHALGIEVREMMTQ